MSLVGDKLGKAGRQAQDAVSRTARDAKNRAQGFAHEQRQRRSHEEVPDDVLVNRVRAEMGHVVAHPAEVTVTALGGRVTLAGKVEENEAAALAERIAKVPGVMGVENRLNAPQTTDRPGVN